MALLGFMIRKSAMSLTPDEQELLRAYRALANIPRLSVRCYLFSGDIRLVTLLFNQIVLGLAPTHFPDQALYRRGKASRAIEFKK